jgi:fructose-specific phosphotransferase system IIC component
MDLGGFGAGFLAGIIAAGALTFGFGLVVGFVAGVWAWNMTHPDERR